MSGKNTLISNFNLLRKNIHEKNLKSDLVTSPLYHFTKHDSFVEIINSENLLLSSFKDKNDKNEFNFAKEFITQTLRKYPSSFATQFLNGFESFVSSIDIYMISFCLKADNAHLWENYGENHYGLALGFNSNFKTNEEVDYDKEWPQIVMAVKYGNDAIREELSPFVITFAKLLQYVYKKDEYLKYVYEFVRNIYPIMSRYKSDEWKYEEEHRWCMMDRGPSKKIPQKFKIDNKAVMFNAVKEHLSEVVIGKASQLDEMSVRNLLNMNGYETSKIQIKKLS